MGPGVAPLRFLTLSEYGSHGRGKVGTLQSGRGDVLNRCFFTRTLGAPHIALPLGGKVPGSH